MKPVQLKMARAALGLGVEDLAAKAGVPAADIAHFESGEGDGHMFEARVRAICEEAGIVWIDEDGVRFSGTASDATIPLEDLNSANDE